MNDNPFVSLVSAIREDNKMQTPAYFRIGIVISNEPLRVSVGGAIQEDDSLIKNSMLTYFEVGENLFLIPMDDEQRYIILCKVVSV